MLIFAIIVMCVASECVTYNNQTGLMTRRCALYREVDNRFVSSIGIEYSTFSNCANKFTILTFASEDGKDGDQNEMYQLTTYEIKVPNIEVPYMTGCSVKYNYKKLCYRCVEVRYNHISQGCILCYSLEIEWRQADISFYKRYPLNTQG